MNALTARKNADKRNRPRNHKTLYEQNEERLKRKMTEARIKRHIHRTIGVPFPYECEHYD